MKTALREIRGIGLTTTELTPADMDHMADDEEMARPERFELPTTWFEGTDAVSGFLINQQVRWPALNVCAAKRRREPRSAA